MEPRIAMVLAHPFTREAVALTTRSLHGETPLWNLDPHLQKVLWSFAKKIAEYASGYPFVLEQVAAYERQRMVFERLSNLKAWLEEAHQDICRQFSSLQGIGTAYDCLMRIAFLTAVVAQYQQISIEPQQFLG